MSQFELWRLCRASLTRYGVMNSCRLLIDDYLFDLKHGTRTAGTYSKSGIEKSNPNLKGTVVQYQGTPSRLFQCAMKDLDSSVLKGDFIDFGCGRGKVLLMAFDYSFKKLYGVELSEKLAKQTEQNLENYGAKKKKKASANICLGDARFFLIPPTASVFFFYNPFTWSIFEQVVENILESLRRHPREARLIYINDQHRKELEKKKMQCVFRGSELRMNYSVWKPLVSLVEKDFRVVEECNCHGFNKGHSP